MTNVLRCTALCSEWWFEKEEISLNKICFLFSIVLLENTRYTGTSLVLTVVIMNVKVQAEDCCIAL